MNNVNQELGRASPYNQTVALNDSVVRTLFGKASGAIAMSDGWGKSNYANSVSFSATGGGTSWTVPAGVTSIKVRMWGAGGGNGLQQNASTSSGGGGGFMEGIISVTPSQVIYIYVGTAGGQNIDDTCECDANNEYPSRIANNYGTGGFHSVVSRGGWASTSNSLDYMIAGAGGGASSYAGGAGGGTTGGNGVTTGSSVGTAGTGGVSGDPGAGGAGGSGYSNGILWQSAAQIYAYNGGGSGRGGEAINCDYATEYVSAGGRGGSGLAGGGAGNAPANNLSCGYVPIGPGGGGGSSGYGRGNGYVNHPTATDWTSVTNTQASGGTAAANGNADYVSGIANSEQPGRIVIRY